MFYSTRRYAFFVEDKVAKFELSKEPCDLVETGIQFGMLSYGFAVKHDSQYKDILNQAILEIIESDYITVQEQR